MLPEIRDRLAKLFSHESSLTELNLKSFNTVDVEAYARDMAWYGDNGYSRIYSLLGGGSGSWAGESVTLNTALNHSVVWACNRIISESIGFLPAVLMQQRGEEKHPAIQHPMYGAMKNAPNDEITAQSFRETLNTHAVLQGNGYAVITRRSNNGMAVALNVIDCNSVFPDHEKGGQKRLVYVVKEDNQPDIIYTVKQGRPHDILHIRGLGWDGVRGYSVIQMGRQSIGAAIAAERNTARFWANGGRVPYLLKMAGKFRNDQEFEAFRSKWERAYSEPHKAPILELGLDYTQTGLSMADSQALESRQFSIPEICRWFSVSPHLVGDLSRATFSNIEHLALEFVKMTLSQWITRWEQEFWRCVLTPEEKAAGYYLKLNVNALLRGDFQTRMAGYASALQNGHLNIDEVRELEDRNKLPDGDGEDYRVQLNMQTVGEPLPQPALPPGRSQQLRRSDNE